MSEMVERVARAIAVEQLRVLSKAVKGPPDLQTLYSALARAAIAAMREPTGAMKDAGAESYGVGNSVIGPAGLILEGQPSKAWQAMIDAALGEPEP